MLPHPSRSPVLPLFLPVERLAQALVLAILLIVARLAPQFSLAEPRGLPMNGYRLPYDADMRIDEFKSS